MGADATTILEWSHTRLRAVSGPVLRLLSVPLTRPPPQAAAPWGAVVRRHGRTHCLCDGSTSASAATASFSSCPPCCSPSGTTLASAAAVPPPWNIVSYLDGLCGPGVALLECIQVVDINRRALPPPPSPRTLTTDQLKLLVACFPFFWGGDVSSALLSFVNNSDNNYYGPVQFHHQP